MIKDLSAKLISNLLPEQVHQFNGVQSQSFTKEQIQTFAILKTNDAQGNAPQPDALSQIQSLSITALVGMTNRQLNQFTIGQIDAFTTQQYASVKDRLNYKRP